MVIEKHLNCTQIVYYRTFELTSYFKISFYRYIGWEILVIFHFVKQIKRRFQIFNSILLTLFFLISRYKNGVPVGSGGRMRVIKEDDVFIFVINEIYDKDEGEFTCEISNTLGTEKAMCRLLLQSKWSSVFVHDKIWVNAITADDLHIKCQYIVEFWTFMVLVA